MLSCDNTKSTKAANQTTLVIFCSLLAISQQLNVLSLLLTIIALCFGMMASWWIGSFLFTICCLVAFLLGLISKYYALRVEFDKKLFDYLVINVDRLPNTLIELDDALLQFNLIKSRQLSVRSIRERQKGTIKLFKKQVIWLVLQILLLIGTLISGIIYFN
ncbi:hypothetical protein GA0061081_102332 [Gilliamella bombicola]|uniref:Uncharacterized protein n=1 Tax=Gilliamella bombicola TaxID=1798182 RepID=A0A1C4ABG0_9GAMM|nr:hypothetical protein [Gilliamella bombicola]SCB91935.1 hypothetical protein GA0061081_102332 [Gilliamella bombicola]